MESSPPSFSWRPLPLQEKTLYNRIERRLIVQQNARHMDNFLKLSFLHSLKLEAVVFSSGWQGCVFARVGAPVSTCYSVCTTCCNIAPGLLPRVSCLWVSVTAGSAFLGVSLGLLFIIFFPEKLIHCICQILKSDILSPQS